MKSLLNLSTYYIPTKSYISCSWQQTTKQPILFSPFFSTNLSQFEQLKKKTNLQFIGPKLKKTTCFGPIKSLFSFSMAKTEKNSWKKLGITLRLFGGLKSRTRYWSLKVYKIMLKCDFMKTLAKLCQRNCFCVQTANQ